MTGKAIPQTDCDQRLFLFCETRPNKARTGTSNNRGVFVCAKTKKDVARGLPYPTEYTDTTFNAALAGQLPLDLCRVTRSVEGPVILVFNYKGHWYLSTNRKLDAFKSYWADPKSSFGLTFARGVLKKLGRADLLELTEPKDIKAELDKVFDEYLDKANRYIFIQPTTFSERLATVPTEEHPIPVHVATFEFHDVEPSPGHDRLTKVAATVTFADAPKEYQLPRQPCNLYKYISNLAGKVNPNKAQGILIETPDRTYIKVLNTEYHQRMQVRGPVASLRGRYMQLRKNPTALAQLTTYYPEVNSAAIEESVAHTCSILDTVYLLWSHGVPQDHIGIFLGQKGYIVESIELSRILYSNLLHQTQVVEAMHKGYTSFQDLSLDSPSTFNTLASRVKFLTTKARYSINDTIQSHIEFLNNLDLNLQGP